MTAPPSSATMPSHFARPNDHDRYASRSGKTSMPAMKASNFGPAKGTSIVTAEKATEAIGHRKPAPKSVLSTEDGDDSEDAAEVEENISTQHISIMARLRKVKSAENEEDFMTKLKLSEEERDSLYKFGEDKKSLLHMLVETANAKSAPLRRFLAKKLLSEKPDLLGAKDASGQTALNKSISRGRDALLEFFLECYPNECRPIINDTQSKGGCLHAVLTAKFEICADMMLALTDERALLSKDMKGNTALHNAVDVALWGDWETEDEARRRVDLIKNMIYRCPRALTETNLKGRSPYRHHLWQLGEIPSLPEGPKKTLIELGKVKFILKDACMHLPTAFESKWVLYGNDPGLQIKLDLSDLTGRTEPLPDDYLDRLTHLGLENILKYVYLPKLTTETYDGEFNAASRGKDKSFLEIFRWLRDRKVQKIIKAVVIDDDKAPHGDDAIEEALSKFDVEIFDWRKVDLCSETIREAAPNVEEVILYSSGNRAVLRSWSGVDGLILLENLKTVRLRVHPAFETQERTTQYIKEFTKRLRDLSIAHGRDILVDPQRDRVLVHHNSKGFDSSFSGQDKQETDSWLRSIDDFGNFLRNIPDEIRERMDRPIKIACLDDGVDVFADELAGRIVEGESFCSTGRKDLGESNYFVSSRGHGTAMAKLICRVFPEVQLYVVKLDGSQTGQPTAESAALGVRWARSKGVDIISMSWSIVVKDRNQAAITELVEEITKAHQQKILMFCAASDEGIDVRRDQTYPASCKDMVFCIGAAISTGQTDSSVGEQSVDFTVPGQVVLEHGPNAKPLAGSSVSTALAAGLSGLILFCVGVSDRELSRFLPVLRQYKGMEKVLQKLARSETDPRATLIRVRDHFAPDFATLDWTEGGSKAFHTMVERLLLYVRDDIGGGRLQRVETGFGRFKSGSIKRMDSMSPM